jgi:Heparinase II/III-like protein
MYHWRLLVFLFLPVFTSAQITPRNLLEKNCSPVQLRQVLLQRSSFHPFPQTPDEWQKQLPDSVLQYFIHNGEEALKGDFPNVPASVTLDFVRDGNRTRYENITFGKRNRLWNLVLAESMEGKKRFTDAIIDGIWSIAEESFWGASAHLFIQKAGRGLPDVEDPVVDLFAAETAANFALADYFVGSELDSVSPLIRKRIYYEVNRRIFIPMQSAKYEWMGKGDTTAKLNNWDPWIISNYLTAALLLEKDPALRLQYVSKSIQLTDQYINGLGDDGGCEEGPSYWTFGAGSVLDILNLLSNASNDRINIYQEKIIQNMGAYIYKTHISNSYFVNVSDAHPEVNPEGVMVWRFGQATGDTSLSNFGAWLLRRDHYKNIINQTFHRTRELFDICNLRAINNDKKSFHDITEVWLPQVQLMTARIPNGLFVAAHGGNNGESHNHNDVGDCIIYADGDPVIIDVGSGTYTAKTFSKDRYTIWFNTSPYHNLPTINGEQQPEGIAYAADHVSYRKDKKQVSLAMNIEKAYPASAGLRSWRRTIAAGPEVIVITDSFAATKPLTSLTQSFMTVCSVDTSQPGILVFTTAHGKKVSLRYGKALQVKKETLSLTTEEEQGLKFTWRNQPITRIVLSSISPVSTGYFQYIISMGTKEDKKSN